jgi:tellurite resistance protein TerC
VDLAAWAWTVPAAALIAVTVAEARLARRSRPDGTGPRAAAVWAGVYLSLAVLFGLGVAAAVGWPAAGQFFAGYLTEYSLSLDNLFVFWVIMRWFSVPPARQQRVLLAGIVLALVLRSALIVAGAAAVSRFSWLFYPLGLLLLWTGAGLLKSPADGAQKEPRSRAMAWLRQRAHQAGDDYGGPLITWRSRRPAIGPLLLLALAIGLADLLFAFDSIPALFGITSSAGLIVACNAFALSGLRQVYVLLTRVLDRIVYLNRGLAVICAFIGAKLLLQALRGSGVAGAPAVPDWLSLAVVGAVLLTTVTAGMAKRQLPGEHPAAEPAPGPDDTARAGDERALLRRFAVIDVDGNGLWQRADYEQLTRRLCDTFGHRAGSAAAQAVAAAQRALFDALLAHMDADGDQQITPDEFTASLGRAVADQPGFDTAVRGAARTLIQAADADGNGVLDRGEYTRLAGVYGASPADAARAFARLDLDRNGVLDTAELATAISQFFASPDTAAPGNLAFGRLLGGCQRWCGSACAA